MRSFACISLAIVALFAFALPPSSPASPHPPPQYNNLALTFCGDDVGRDLRWVTIPPKSMHGIRRHPVKILMRDDMGRCMFGGFCDLYGRSEDDDPHVEEFIFLARRSLGPGKTALDVGSNLGHKSLSMNAVGFSTISIEPQDLLRNLHEKSRRVNDFEGAPPERDAIIDGIIGNGMTTSMWMPGHSSEAWPHKVIRKPTSNIVTVSKLAFDMMKVDIDGYECFIAHDIRPPYIVEVTLKMWKSKCGFDPTVHSLAFAVNGWLVGPHPLNVRRDGLLRRSNATKITSAAFLASIIALERTFTVAKL